MTMRPTLIPLLVLLSGSAGFAQTSQPADQLASGTTCTYDACALRVHRRFAATWIVRGIHEEKALKLGFTAAGMDSLVAASDAAVAHARTFRHHYTIAGVLNVLSLGAGLAASITSSKHKEVALGLTIGSFGLGFAASQERRVANNALDRSLSWYNGTLDRSKQAAQLVP